MPPKPNSPAPKSMFDLPSSDSPQSVTWNKDKDAISTIKIALEHNDGDGTVVVCDQVPIKYLLVTAPSLFKSIEDDKIVLPGQYVDDDILHEVINSIVLCGEQGTPFGMHVDNHPTPYINLHIVLVLLGMNREAEVLLQHMWRIFDTYELQPVDVLWIWETFGTESDACQTSLPPDAEMYVQMMASQIVAGKVAGKLNPLIHALVLGKQYARLRAVVQQREKDYGVAQGYKSSKSSEVQQQELNAFRELDPSPKWKRDTTDMEAKTRRSWKAEVSIDHDTRPNVGEIEKRLEDKRLEVGAAEEARKMEAETKALKEKQEQMQKSMTPAMQAALLQNPTFKLDRAHVGLRSKDVSYPETSGPKPSHTLDAPKFISGGMLKNKTPVSFEKSNTLFRTPALKQGGGIPVFGAIASFPKDISTTRTPPQSTSIFSLLSDTSAATDSVPTSDQPVVAPHNTTTNPSGLFGTPSGISGGWSAPSTSTATTTPRTAFPSPATASARNRSIGPNTVRFGLGVSAPIQANTGAFTNVTFGSTIPSQNPIHPSTPTPTTQRQSRNTFDFSATAFQTPNVPFPFQTNATSNAIPAFGGGAFTQPATTNSPTGSAGLSSGVFTCNNSGNQFGSSSGGGGVPTGIDFGFQAGDPGSTPPSTQRRMARPTRRLGKR